MPQPIPGLEPGNFHQISMATPIDIVDYIPVFIEKRA